MFILATFFTYCYELELRTFRSSLGKYCVTDDFTLSLVKSSYANLIRRLLVNLLFITLVSVGRFCIHRSGTNRTVIQQGKLKKA